MLIIGLTGGIGSGKTTVANYFAELGIEIIDTDQLAREVVAPGTEALNKIVNQFGPALLTSEKQLNRKRLREIIFANTDQRRWLENLLHPLIRKKMEERTGGVQSPYCIVIIPLLAETQPNPLITRVLVVDTTEDRQLAFAAIRDQSNPAEIKAILESQANREKRLALADDVIYNDKDFAHLKKQVLALHKKYLQLSSDYSI